MKSPDPSSEDSLSQSINRTNKRVRFHTSDKFKVNLGKIKQQQRVSQLIKPQQLPVEPKQQQEDPKQSLYFRVRVISKIGVFIEKLKAMVTLSNPNFKYNEMGYIQSQISNDDQKSFLFSAQNKLVVLFEVILLLMSVLSIWNVSFLIIFWQTYLLPFELRIFMLVMFTLEIVVNMFVIPSNSRKQQDITAHKHVIIHYLTSNFFYDAISLLSLIIIQLVSPSSPALYLVKILATLKMGTVLRIIKKLETMFITTVETESKINIFMLIMKILTFVHFLSLMLNLVNQIEINSGIVKTWVTEYGMGNASDFELYLCGWYWGATILTTVGFGDISPGNIYQAFIISLVQILCCAIFGYSINYIGGLIGVLGESTELFEKQMRRVNQYLENLDVNRGLKEQIRQHFYNKEKIKKYHDPVAQSIVMDNIPVSMKTEVLSTNNKNVLQKTSFFTRYNDDIINLLAMKLKRIIYSPDESIFNKGDSNAKLWILEKGHISEFYNNQPNNKEKIIAEYNTTTVQPGYINFITGQPFTTYCRSMGFSWTYQVSRDDMLSVIGKFKSQYHKFCQLKDRLIQKGKKFVSRCCACMKLSHNALQCPKIHFQARSRMYKLASLTKSQTNNLRHFYPRSNQKYKSLAIFSSMADEQSLAASSIYVNNNRRMSVEEMIHPKFKPRDSHRISTLLLLDRIPFQFQTTIPSGNICLPPASKQNLKTQSQANKAEELGPQEKLDFNFWFDQCKYTDAESYFAESHVKNILNEYNNKMVKKREDKIVKKKY